MDLTGRLIDIQQDFITGKMRITLEVNERAAVVAGHEALQGCDLDIKLGKHREKRSLDANAMLWACLGEIAQALSTDKWEIYLQMLKRYGKYTYILVTEKAVEAVKQQWRESEVVGEVDVNGRKAYQMLCYYGSSTLNTKEFSTLLNGVVSEMVEMGLPAPTSKDMRRALERYEQQHPSE